MRGDPSEDEGSDNDSGPDVSDEALQALWDRRLELEADRAAEPEAFGYNLRGGAWTHAHHGVAYDSFRASPLGAAVAAFCGRHGLPKSATFSIRKYGEEACTQLCKLWVHRLSFWHGVWLARGGEADFRFRESDGLPYRRSPEAESLAASPEAMVRERALQVEATRPKFHHA